MERACVLMSNVEMEIEKLMRFSEFPALCEYNGRHRPDDETHEETILNDLQAAIIKRRAYRAK